MIRKRFSLLWSFPLLTAIAAGYLLYDTYFDRGPLITILYPEASNLEAGLTTLRYRGITVGKIESIELDKSLEEVVIKARLHKSATALAREGSKFTLVQPQISLAGVQDLDTIVGGSYIRIDPGKGKPQKEFKGQTVGEESALEGMATYLIVSPQMFSISEGDPVTYRGLKIGRIAQVKLSDTSQKVIITFAIEIQYRKLIRTNTVIWRASGIQADLGLFSSKVDITSVEALMKGAVALAVPAAPGEIVKSGHIFNLVGEAPEDWMKWSPDLSTR